MKPRRPFTKEGILYISLKCTRVYESTLKSMKKVAQSRRK